MKTSNLYYPFMFRHESGGLSFATIRAGCLREALERAKDISGKGVISCETIGMGEQTQQEARNLWPLLKGATNG